MGYRIFTDSQGVEWQAWDIIPRLAERRARERRSVRAVVKAERRTDDRRKVAGERTVLGNGMNHGWLCFEALREKRRLAPIPPDWLRCAVARLEEYLRAAVPAVRINIPDMPMLANLDQRAG